jgi:hypothetical protein
MANNMSRRGVLLILAGAATAMVGSFFGKEARADFIRNNLSRVDDVSAGPDGRTEQANCHCTCGDREMTSSTFSHAAGSGRKRR